MTRTLIWTHDRDAALETAWAADVPLDHLPAEIVAATGHLFTLKAIEVRAQKLGLRRTERRVDQGRPVGVIIKPIAARVVEERRRVRPDVVRLVKPGSFPAPARGFTMLGRPRH